MTINNKNKTEIVYTIYHCEYNLNGDIKSRTKKKEYKTIKEAQEYVDKFNNKQNKSDKPKKKKYIDAIIVSTPKNIQVGTKFEIKNSNNEWELYGTISRVTENFYYYDKPNGKVALYGNFFEIGSFMDKIANEVIRVVIEN